MRKFFLLTAFFVFFTIQFVCVPVTHAQGAAGLAAGHFVEEGRMYYEQGKYKRAIDSFSKALLSDPDNQEAKEYLHKMGVSGSIYMGRDASLDEITRLSQTVSELKAKNERAVQETQSLHKTVDDLQGQKTNLEDQLARKKEEIVSLNADLFQMQHALTSHLNDIQEKARELDKINTQLDSAGDEVKTTDTKQLERDRDQHEQEIAALRDKLKTVQEKADSGQEAQKARVKELENELAKKQTNLMMVNDKLVLAKRKIRERYAQLSEKEKTINGLKRSLKQMKEDLQQARLKMRVVGHDRERQDQLVADRQEQAEVLKKQDAFIVELKDKLAETKRELAGLKEKFRGQSGTGGEELQTQLDDTMKQLDETQTALKEKDNEYKVLQQRFDDTRERLKLVEGLMKDKDSQVEDLEKQLNTILEKPDKTQQ